MVDAVEVVEAQVGVELAAQATERRVHVAGKGRAPALVEDRLVQRLDVAVGLRASGVDAALLGTQALGGEAELALELVCVVAEEALQAPARIAELAGDVPRKARGLLCGGIARGRLGDHELGPGERGGDVDRRQVPVRPLGAAQAPDVEAVDPDQLAGMIDVDVPLGAWVAGGS